MAMNPVGYLVQDAPFAKVVNTADGEALMIGHDIFHVTGPRGNAACELSTVLRRVANGEVKLCGDGQPLSGGLGGLGPLSAGNEAAQATDPDPWPTTLCQRQYARAVSAQTQND